MALRHTTWAKIRLGLLFVLLLIFPFVANNYWLNLANQIGIAAIGAIGLNLLVGFTGQISLGQGAFLAVGAYTAAILAAHAGLPFVLLLPAAGLMTALVGGFFGIPSLRLKGLYLAIATLAAQEIIIWIIKHWTSVTGGESFTLPEQSFFGIPLNRGEAGSSVADFRYYWVIIPLAVVAAQVATNLLRTKTGRAFIAVRDRDIAAEVMGINLFRTKLQSFAVSSFYVGVAGALMATYRGVIGFESFEIDKSVLYLAMIIVGGLGSVSGAIYGAAFMLLVPELIRLIAQSFQQSSSALAALLPGIQQGVFGLIIILFLILEPEGLAKLWNDIRNYFRLWPFSY